MKLYLVCKVSTVLTKAKDKVAGLRKSVGQSYFLIDYDLLWYMYKYSCNFVT